MLRRLVAAVVVLALAPSASRAEGAALQLRVSATAHGPNVLLGDVLEGLSGAAAVLPLRPSGLPGGELTVGAALVGLKLRRAPGGPYQLGGAEACKISVPAQVIPGEELRKFAQDFLEARLSGTAGATLKPLGVVNDVKLYDAPVRLECPPLEDGQLRGNLVLRLRVLQEGPDGSEHEAASVPMSFLIKRMEARLVATKVIRKGDPLGAENLELRQDDATFEDRGFASLDQVQGMRAHGYVGAGKVLTRSMVEFPPLIRRGDIIRVLVRSGGVVVESSGKALRDAQEGEGLPVQLQETKKQIQARCVEAGVAVYEAR